jgi:hypothetical protein
MKGIFVFIFSAALCFKSFSQDSTKHKLVLDKHKPVLTIETACGTCMFKMKGSGCVLAVKYKGKSYFVTGTDIDDHGDAHDKDGFCNAIRKANIQGSVVRDKFVITYFALIKPIEKLDYPNR